MVLGAPGLLLTPRAALRRGGVELFPLMQAAGPSVLFAPSQLSGNFQERTGASATTPAAADDPVGSFKNWGALGGWATAAADPGRPVLRNSAGRYRLAFDGVDDFLRIAFAAPQPFVRVSAIGIKATGSTHVIGGVTANAGALFTHLGDVALYSGVELRLSGYSAAPAVYEERHDGANSRIRIDSGAYTTGDAGATVGGGMTIGANLGDTQVAEIDVFASVAWFGSEPSADDLALARAFCAAECGVSL